MPESERRLEQRDAATMSEKDLLLSLRGGNLESYEELWCRHHRSALTLANQLLPGHAEDLVAESFTAVLHTITVSNKGPVDGFRAYLFATIRNSAARWNRDGHIVSQTNNNLANPDIVDIQFDYKPGDEVHKFKVGPHRIGHVITKGKTLEEAVDTLNDALTNIEINVE